MTHLSTMELQKGSIGCWLNVFVPWLMWVDSQRAYGEKQSCMQHGWRTAHWCTILGRRHPMKCYIQRNQTSRKCPSGAAGWRYTTRQAWSSTCMHVTATGLASIPRVMATIFISLIMRPLASNEVLLLSNTKSLFHPVWWLVHQLRGSRHPTSNPSNWMPKHPASS